MVLRILLRRLVLQSLLAANIIQAPSSKLQVLSSKLHFFCPKHPRLTSSGASLSALWLVGSHWKAKVHPTTQRPCTASRWLGAAISAFALVLTLRLSARLRTTPPASGVTLRASGSRSGACNAGWSLVFFRRLQRLRTLAGCVSLVKHPGKATRVFLFGL